MKTKETKTDTFFTMLISDNFSTGIWLISLFPSSKGIQSKNGKVMCVLSFVILFTEIHFCCSFALLPVLNCEIFNTYRITEQLR